MSTLRGWRTRGLLGAIGLLLFAASVWGAPALWEVSDARGRVKAYLFGTIHLCSAECYPLPQRVWSALEAADALALELDVSDPSVIATLAVAGMLPPGQHLRAVLPEALFGDLNAAAADLGVPLTAVGAMRPWFASSLLMSLAAAQAGFSADSGVDSALLRRARDAGKSLVALESVERQIEALSAGGERAQHAALSQTVRMIRAGEVGDYLARLVAAWRAGDDAALTALVFEEVEAQAVAPLVDVLIERRNGEMADHIEALARKADTVFVAVGSGHMVGERGIPALLAARGWRVRRVADY